MDDMKLTSIDLFRYRLQLARPVTSDASLTHREGLVIRMTDEAEHTGLGEIAPLPGFSPESLAECEQQAVKWRWGALSQEVPLHLEELSGAFEQWLGQHNLAPSVRCGIEMATLSLLASSRGCSIGRLLTDSPSEGVEVNALLAGNASSMLKQAKEAVSQGYRTVKLKIGRNGLAEAVELIERVRDTVGPDVKLRLDANGTFEVHTALQLLEKVSRLGIEYMEEPVSGISNLSQLLRSQPDASVAIDESLLSTTPTMLRELPALTAVILKPTLLGIERSMAFARAAVAMGATPVVTSMFESGLGLASLAQLASVVTPRKTAVGLDTRRWLAEDILIGDIYTHPGEIRLDQLAGKDCEPKMDRLQKVECDTYP
ncbi:o-succinylbenzoate synthase [candidate division GN15 bacterium]|nr:o-succinylbenzoate synthase [candidate division GN15 bacterium]